MAALSGRVFPCLSLCPSYERTGARSIIHRSILISIHSFLTFCIVDKFLPPYLFMKSSNRHRCLHKQCIVNQFENLMLLYYNLLIIIMCMCVCVRAHNYRE